VIWSLHIYGSVYPANESGIHFESTGSYRYEGGPVFCNTRPSNEQLVTGPVQLKEIGLKAQDVKNGVNCLAGDFDGNGYLDFLFWKGEYLANSQRYKAVFFNRDRVQSTKIVLGDDKFSYWASSYKFSRNQAGHYIANLSGIRLGGPLEPIHGYALCRITGSNDYGLQQTGLEHNALRSGTNCIVSDLDGNGFYDFVFIGPVDREAFFATDDMKKREALSPTIMILFFQKEKLIRTQIIAKHGYDHIDSYGPIDTKGQFGEPKTKLPGLIQYGEGGSTTVYLYNPKTKLMESSFYPSEYE